MSQQPAITGTEGERLGDTAATTEVP